MTKNKQDHKAAEAFFARYKTRSQCQTDAERDAHRAAMIALKAKMERKA